MMVKKILILAANPKDTPRLRLDQEVREIESGLSRSQQRDNFILKQIWATRPKDVRRAMLDFKPNIVHFCGHGGGKDGIAFEDDNGDTKLVSADALSGFFELFADTVECILLNACYSEIQAEAIKKHIKYVVGMKKGIGDSAAIEFAVAFYDAIGAGESLEFAYKLGCNAIQWTGLPEHLTPILKLQTDEMRQPEHLKTETNLDVVIQDLYNLRTSNNKPLNSLSPKEFMKLVDIANPIDEEVITFSLSKNIEISDNDPNAEEWASIKGLRTYNSIAGFWSSRWYHKDLSEFEYAYQKNGKYWLEGTAQIVTEEDWVYIYYEDKSNRYAIIAKIDNDMLVGRYINLNIKFDTTPWIGRVVNNRRIDGIWLQGRWDFRR
jgi:hypothetical protein